MAQQHEQLQVDLQDKQDNGKPHAGEQSLPPRAKDESILPLHRPRVSEDGMRFVPPKFEMEQGPVTLVVDDSGVIRLRPRHMPHDVVIPHTLDIRPVVQGLVAPGEVAMAISGKDWGDGFEQIHIKEDGTEDYGFGAYTGDSFYSLPTDRESMQCHPHRGIREIAARYGRSGFDKRWKEQREGLATAHLAEALTEAGTTLTATRSPFCAATHAATLRSMYKTGWRCEGGDSICDGISLAARDKGAFEEWRRNDKAFVLDCGRFLDARIRACIYIAQEAPSCFQVWSEGEHKTDFVTTVEPTGIAEAVRVADNMLICIRYNADALEGHGRMPGESEEAAAG